MKTHTTGADEIVEVLRRHGVTTIFTLSGNQVLPLFDSLFDADIRLLSTRHEAAAVHMADAWGQLTGEPGVALVTAGPGHGNSLTALAVTRGNESPVLLISGAAEARTRGTGAFQDLPQAELAASVSKWAGWVDDAASAGALVERAWGLAEAPVPGPVSLSLPYDVQLARVDGGRALGGGTHGAEGGSLAPAAEGFIRPFQSPLNAAPAPIDDLVAAIAGAREPLLLGSPWVTRTPEFRAAAAHLGCPAFALESPRAASDPLLFGSEGAFGRADLVVLLAPWDYVARTESVQKIRAVVQVWPDDDPGPTPSYLRRLRAQPRAALRAILALPLRGDAGGRTSVEEQEAARASLSGATSTAAYQGVHPLRLAEGVRGRLGARDVVTLDGGEFCCWIRLGLAWGPWRTLINGKFGPIGTAVPHALGARATLGREPAVVGFAGDGGFGYHALEIETAAREGLPAVLIVGTDGKWGAEWHLQRLRYGADRVIGSELSTAHYEELARGLGGVGLLLENDAQIEDTLDTAWSAMRAGRVVLVNALVPPLASPSALH